MAADESEAETDEEKIDLQDAEVCDDLADREGVKFETARQASLKDTTMAGPSGAGGTIDVTPGLEAQHCLSSSVPSLEGENQFGKTKEQSACRRVVSRCSVGSPKVTELEDTEGKGKKVMELTKGWIAELIGEPDLLR
uniref:Uncharacterized protein n=1 Tax=Solanum tuberosum TaxID=4113 RepID=M1DH89_SOLTU